MPVHSCNRGGKSGHQWGGHGKCYIGPGSAKKAAKQGAAAHAHGFIEGAKRRGPIQIRRGK